MSLHGLLDAVVRDPALAEAVKTAGDGHRMHVDLVGPPAARPFAVDVASGTEASPGRKDPAKLTAFVRAVEEADARLGALA